MEILPEEIRTKPEQHLEWFWSWWMWRWAEGWINPQPMVSLYKEKRDELWALRWGNLNSFQAGVDWGGLRRTLVAGIFENIIRKNDLYFEEKENVE